MNISAIFLSIDWLATAFALGATAWFFFVQSPVLLKMLGREKFVPIQMRLTFVLFRLLTILLLMVLMACLAHSTMTAPTTLAAAIALMAVLINQFYGVPRALRAGGQSRTDIKGKDSEGTTLHFASEGVGNRTQYLHRLVVLFVLLMVIGLIVHGINLLAI